MSTNNNESESFSDSSSSTNVEKKYKDAEDVIFTNKEKFYYISVDKFFKQLSLKNIKLMVDIIEKRAKISLRLLDWYVTKYANDYITLIPQDNDEAINIHISYKAQLRSYRKRYFDPFRRRKKFYYTFNKRTNNEIKQLTTIGQLNFFRWAFQIKIIDKVDENYEILAEEMFKSNKEEKKKKKKRSNDKKSKDSSKKSNKSVEQKIDHKSSDGKIVVSFD